MSSYYQISETPDFHRKLYDLDRAIFAKWQRVGRIIYKDPFHSSLKTELVKGSQHGTYSVRLDDNYRIIFRHIKPDQIVLLWVDKHDPAYIKAQQITPVVEKGIFKIVDVADSDTGLYDNHISDNLTNINGALFRSWSDDELLGSGLTTEWLPIIRQMNVWTDLEKVEGQIPNETINYLLNLIANGEESDQDTQLRAKLIKPETREDIHVFDNYEEFEKALEGSLEEWMLFLHPSQKQIIEANYNGPARVKGAAGTGKTVLAIHRARYIAKNLDNPLDKVLFLSYNRQLAGIVNELQTRQG
jgi:mRNA-degrading endonuclease RelE of RelBE toxin-antitoxin system